MNTGANHLESFEMVGDNTLFMKLNMSLAKFVYWVKLLTAVLSSPCQAARSQEVPTGPAPPLE